MKRIVLRITIWCVVFGLCFSSQWVWHNDRLTIPQMLILSIMIATSAVIGPGVIGAGNHGR